MNFNQMSYWPGILIVALVLISLVLMLENRFFKFVKTYWFFRRSVFSYISSLLFVLGMGGLLFSLLDIRGPEEKIKMDVPSDRTIILIDTSASMLAEDVKPSRLQKATLVAKHFARKAAGHQISIIAFAEIQKKIVPFTNDLDLIDSRLDSLKNLRNQYGSSALSVAIQESVQYFREANGEGRGNILVFTDGEETAEGIDLKVPKGVHVALVGVGTSQGGRIPLDDGRGFRFGYKKERGRDVITKLNENFFKDIVSKIPSGKYWLTNSYSLPSEEILDFFQNEKVKSNEQQDMVIKPVLMEWVVIPSLLLMFLSYLFKSFRVFTLGMILIIMPVHAQKEEPEINLSPEVLSKLNDLQQGNLSRLEKIKLADDLQKSGAKDEAISLYSENLSSRIEKDIPPQAYLNYGTTLLEKENVASALEVYQKLANSLDDSADSEKIKQVMDKNIVSYFQQQEKKKQEQKKKDKEKKDEKQDKDQQKNNESGQGQSKESQGDSKENQKKNDQKNKDDQGQDNKDKEKDQNDKQDSDEEKKDEKQDKGEDSDKPLPPKKLPAKLKQLMSDDRQLQMKMIENGTRDLNKRKSRKSKDW